MKAVNFQHLEVTAFRHLGKCVPPFRDFTVGSCAGSKLEAAGSIR
jgi:hypothetical protein